MCSHLVDLPKSFQEALRARSKSGLYVSLQVLSRHGRTLSLASAPADRSVELALPVFEVGMLHLASFALSDI
jgi:hypothetical protein